MTNARPYSAEGSHWYTTTGEPMYEIQAKNGSMRNTTLADARKLNLLPSVTTILKSLHKQALVDWLVEQAVLAVLTTPRLNGEGDDVFVQRVLHQERVQDQESQAAKDRGTAIHKAMEDRFHGEKVAEDVWPWCVGAFGEIASRGRVLAVESCVVGDGYAGKVDLIQENGEIWIYDWKTTKKLPTKGAWLEHVLQASAYAKAFAMRGNTGNKRIRTANVYISTVEQGQFVVCEHGDWEPTYNDAFAPLLKVWQWMNDYRPTLNP